VQTPPEPRRISRPGWCTAIMPMAYEAVAAFIGKLREREATAALALEFCVLTAARSGEVLGAR
jgi:hypothetical protein